jgi:hypothetical protein
VQSFPSTSTRFPAMLTFYQERLRVTGTQTGKTRDFRTGDFIAESVDQWHKGANVGQDAVKLIVIDITEGDRTNRTVRWPDIKL